MGFIHEGLPLYLYHLVLKRCRDRNFQVLPVHVSKTTSKRKRGTKIE